MPVADSQESGGSQAVKAQLRLREMILAGELPSGERITELDVRDAADGRDHGYNQKFRPQRGRRASDR